MADPGPNAIVDERLAAVLLGITPPELRWFSRALGLGKKQQSGEASPVFFFNYEELKRLSSAAASSAK